MPSLAYRLSAPDPRTHTFHVRVEAHGLARDLVDLVMPVWAPGSYLVREFARNVTAFTARDGRGRKLPWTRPDKCTWRVEAGGADVVRAEYDIFAHELSVQTSHLDTSHGYANGTSTFMYVDGAKELPCDLTIEPPRGWNVDVGLDEAGRNRFRVPDYDTLADAPIEMGTHRRLDFRVGGVDHRVALWGRGNEDVDVLVRDLGKIAREEAAIFGGQPFDRFLWIVHLTNGKWGGLEHLTSTTLHADRWTFSPRKEYTRFLGLAAHEFFHVWNVKRIRPKALGPFDYTRENHTTLLWAMEGLTSYYDHLILARAGLLPEDRYREYLAETLQKLLDVPGRRVQSLCESSDETWVKFYRPDGDSPNRGVSYYLKGELVGAALDLEIRRRTRGRKGLDDVFRHLWENVYLAGATLEEDGFERAVETVTGLPWGAWFARYVRGREDPDWKALFAAAGWDLRPVQRGEEARKDPKKRWEAVPSSGAWLGLTTRKDEGAVRTQTVYRGSPAERAGVAPGDELVSLGGFRVTEDALKKRLAELAPGARVRLAVFRRDELVTLDVRLGAPPPEKWKLDKRKGAPAQAKRLRKAWLAPRAGRNR
ncbi:MAG TPA: PDZ domain-containing protein [Candidatus Thermoplasmatota archaeon]|nr:PDZ domain-containing protein [Candidatus Thermoplasmatota archaeon]